MRTLIIKNSTDEIFDEIIRKLQEVLDIVMRKIKHEEDYKYFDTVIIISENFNDVMKTIDKIKDKKKIYVLAKSSNTQERCKALKAGADDILDLSMCFEEISIRTIEKHNTCQDYLTHLNFHLERNKSLLCHNNQSIYLTPIEFRIIHSLFEGKGRIISISSIKVKIWQEEHVSNKTINTHISNLRKKLKRLNVNLERSTSGEFRIYV